MPKHNFFWYFQTFMVFCSNRISKFFLHKKVYGLENLAGLKGGRVLFVANHGGLFDPFVIGPSLPRSYLSTVKAYRLLTYYKHIWRRWYGIFIWMAGAYSVRPRGGKDLDKTLSKTLKLLEDNQCVMVFPTGARLKGVDPKEARPGAGYIAKTLDPVIVPAYVSDTYRVKIKDFFLRKRHVKVIYGKPFRYDDLPGNKEDYRDIAFNIMQKVKDLEAGA